MNTSVPAVVLKTFHGGLGVARSLGRLGVPVYGVHDDAQAPGARSRYLREVWKLDLDATPAAEAVAFLLERADGLDRPILFATDDSGGLFVAENAAALEAGFRIAVPPVEVVRSLASKQGLTRVCAEHGIATPATAFPRSRDDVVVFAEQAVFPVVLKGIKPWRLFERTGLRLKVALSRDSLLTWYDRLEDPAEPNILLQEYIPGGSDSVWMFEGYFGESSECLFGLTAQKLRQYPRHGGVTSLGGCLPNAEVEELTKDLMRRLRYRGILDIGYRFDRRDGTYKLLDANPRLGVTFRLFVDSVGMDVARALNCDVTGQPVRVGQPCPGRRWQVENLDLASAARHMRRRELSIRGWLCSLRGIDERAWYAGDDPRPFLAMCCSLVCASFRWVLRLDRGRVSRARATRLDLAPAARENY